MGGVKAPHFGAIMKIRDIELMGTTSSGGAMTVTSTESVSGFLYKVKWVDGDLADGGTGTITVTGTPEEVDETVLTLANPLINADDIFYPRDIPHSLAGAALTATHGGDRVMPLVVGKLKLVISSGGATKSGGCHVYILEDE